MTEAKKTKKSRNIIRWLGIGFALFFAAFLVSLLCLALIPTGYQKFEQAHRESAVQVNSWIKSDTASPPPSRSADSRPAVAVPKPLNPNTRPDFYNGIRELASVGYLPNLSYTAMNSMGVIRWDRVLVSPGKLKSGTLRALVESDPEIHNEILRIVAKPDSDYLPWTAPDTKSSYASFKDSSTTAPLTAQNRTTFNQGVDRADLFLLEENMNIPDFEHNQKARMIAPGWFYRAAALAILRADLRGEGAKAARLLSRAMAISRIQHLNKFPSNEHYFLLNGPLHSVTFDNQTIPLLLDLSITLNDAELAQAASILEQSLLTPEMYQKFFDAYALQNIREFRQRSLLQHPDNGWHRFLGGGPERIVTTVLHPVAARSLERLTAGWADPAQRNLPGAKAIPYEILRVAMNFDRSAMGGWVGSPMSPEYQAGPNGDNFNQDIQLMRVVLACVRWHRLHGHYPARIGDLAPTYLDRPFTGSPSSGWMVLSATSPGTSERPVFCYFGVQPASAGKGAPEPKISILVGTPVMPLVDGRIVDLLKNP